MTAPLFQFPIPSSRSTVPTGYGYRLPDQNGWSRYLQFEAAWFAVITGCIYFGYRIVAGTFPAKPATRAQRSFADVLQRITYLLVIFVLSPLAVWTGLAMSPAIASAFPATVNILGGQQSARTIHFFVSVLLALFLAVHIVMVARSGFRNRMQEMISGQGPK